MAALRYVGVAAVIFAIPLAYWARQDTPALPAFEEVRTDVYRLNLECRSPILATMSVAAWLINVDKNSWVLVDSGLDIPANIEALVAGLREKMGLAQDSLKLILTTHGHADHTGGLSTLLDLYPNVKVAYHKQEEAYLSGGGSYADLQGDTNIFNFFKPLFKFNTTLVPKSRSLILTGDSGDLSKLSSSIPKGILEFHTVPGHTPGQIAVFHKPTGSFIAADSLMQLPPWWPWIYSGQPVVHNPVAIGSFSMQPVRKSQQKIAALPGVKTYFPSHDDNRGVSKKQLTAFLSA